jgi:hypothetical protein
MNPEMQRRAHKKAAELGISFAEYVRRLIDRDLGAKQEPEVDVSIIFDLGASEEPTNIARDKDKMVGEAVWQNYLRKTGRLKKKRSR